jgi:uncharacterized protein YecE (DUF72 family)
LTTWAQRIKDLFGVDPDGYAFFNNDARACAIRDAASFRRLTTHGLLHGGRT